MFKLPKDDLNNRTFIELLVTKYDQALIRKYLEIHSEDLKGYIATTKYSDLKWCFSINDNDTIDSAFLKIGYQDTSQGLIQTYIDGLNAMGK